MESEYLSDITKLLLKKYNKPFDSRSKELTQIQKNCEKKNTDIKNVMKAYLTDLVKLDKNELFTLTNLEKPTFLNEKVPCNFTKNLKNIYNIDFIEDYNLVQKIIQYRIQEVIKELTLIKYYFSVYQNIVACIINLIYKDSKVYNNDANEIIMSEQNSSFNVFRYQRDKPDKNTVLHEKYDTNLEKLKHYKNELEKILEEQFINNKVYLLKNILCRYIFLEKKFNIIRKKM
jgi:hypothetical protein